MRRTGRQARHRRGPRPLRRWRAGIVVAVLANAVLVSSAAAAWRRVEAARPLERGEALVLASRPGVPMPVPASPAPQPPPPPPPVPTPPAGNPTQVAPPAPPVPAARAVARRGAPGSPQARGQEALARIGYPWQELGVTIAFLPGRPGFLGKTFPQRSHIEMYVRPGQSTEHLAYMLAHEIGHMVDWRYGTAERRNAWKSARGIPSSLAWFGIALRGGDDLSTPVGDFAETFALWQVGPVDYRSRLGRPPDPAALQSLIPFFVR